MSEVKCFLCITSPAKAWAFGGRSGHRETGMEVDMARLRRLDDLIASLAKKGISAEEALVDEDSLLVQGEEEAENEEE
ncbi:hypothetical protein ES703_04129 [subsurface metagenome]